MRGVTSEQSMTSQAGNGNASRDDETGSSSQQAAMTPEVTSRGEDGVRDVSEPLVMILEEVM